LSFVLYCSIFKLHKQYSSRESNEEENLQNLEATASLVLNNFKN